MQVHEERGIGHNLKHDDRAFLSSPDPEHTNGPSGRYVELPKSGNAPPHGTARVSWRVQCPKERMFHAGLLIYHNSYPSAAFVLRLWILATHEANKRGRPLSIVTVGERTKLGLEPHGIAQRRAFNSDPCARD